MREVYLWIPCGGPPVFQQFGATIDMLENALLTCPSTQWQGRLWSDHSDPEYPAFWSITYHTLFWLDLYLTGSREGFAPPAPFMNKLDPAGVLPERPYSRDELHAYLVHLREARARQRLPGCQTSKRTNRSISPGWREIRSAF
jgi:hypothetical protein